MYVCMYVCMYVFLYTCMFYCLLCIINVVEWVMVAVVMLLGVGRGTSISSYYNGDLTWGKLQQSWFIMGPLYIWLLSLKASTC